MRARARAAVALGVVLVLGGAPLVGCGKSEGTTTTSAADAVVVIGRAAEAGAPRVSSAARADAGPTAEDTTLPPAGSDELSARMRHMLEAVAQGNGELAGDVLFPRDAYLLLKDSPDAAKAWEKRVHLPFQRGIERIHKHTKGASAARFVGFELGRSVQQLSAKRKEWKAPVWRVKGSKLTFLIDGKPHHVRIAEMVAFRGSWYVTRLR
jgi:hypothetical protein